MLSFLSIFSQVFWHQQSMVQILYYHSGFDGLTAANGRSGRLQKTIGDNENGHFRRNIPGDPPENPLTQKYLRKGDNHKGLYDRLPGDLLSQDLLPEHFDDIPHPGNCRPVQHSIYIHRA